MPTPFAHPAMCASRPRKMWIAFGLITIFLVSGCGQVLHVTRVKTPLPDVQKVDDCKKSENKSSCKLPGLPFYSVAYRCVHTTVWVQPIYTVSVSVKFPDGSTHALGLKSFGLEAYRDPTVQQFLFTASLPIDSQRSEQSFEQKWEHLNGDIDPYELDEDKIGESKRVYLYSNSISAERYVDTTSLMFLNTSKPLAGSAEATASLNADGTLSSGTAKEESKTLATFTALLPTSDLVKSAPQLFASGQPENYTAIISTKVEFYKHTHSAPVEGTSPCGVPKGKNDVVVGAASVVVEHVGDLPQQTPSDAPKSDNPKKTN